jgi:hypothetical protein
MSADPKNRVVSWRAWYVTEAHGLLRFDSRKTQWKDLPKVGALVFVLYYEGKGCRIMSGRSLYWREQTSKGVIYACDDMADAILPTGGKESPFVKLGKWTTDEIMTQASDEAQSLQKKPPE